MDVEAVGEGEGIASLQVILDVLLVDLGLGLVRSQDHDDVGFLSRGVHVDDLEAGLTGLLGGGAALTQADAHVATGVHEVQGVSVALGAVADDGDLLVLNDLRLAIVLVVDGNSHAMRFLSLLCALAEYPSCP